jgi:PKD repeat protein
VASTDQVFVSNYDGASLSLLQAEPLQVDLSATPRSGNAPLDVQFTSVLTGAGTAYQWEFGDRGTSSDANPAYIYTAAGSYSVKLSVTGPGGAATMIKSSYIIVNPAPGAPTADFTASVVSGLMPLNVSFTAVATGTVTTWLWNFGDGSSASTGPAVQHTYSAPGNYDVTLTVGNSNGSYIVSRLHYIAVLGGMIYLPIIIK